MLFHCAAVEWASELVELRVFLIVSCQLLQSSMWADVARNNFVFGLLLLLFCCWLTPAHCWYYPISNNWPWNAYIFITYSNCRPHSVLHQWQRRAAAEQLCAISAERCLWKTPSRAVRPTCGRVRLCHRLLGQRCARRFATNTILTAGQATVSSNAAIK